MMCWPHFFPSASTPSFLFHEKILVHEQLGFLLLIFHVDRMSSVVTMLLQKNKFKAGRKLCEFITAVCWVQRELLESYAFLSFVCFSSEGNIVIFVDGVSIDGRDKQISWPAFWGRWKCLCFLMTLFFQSWLYGNITLTNIGWPWNILKSKGFVNVLSITMAEESKHNILHTFPRALMDGFQYDTFMLAVRPQEEFKINDYWKHNEEESSRMFCTIFLFLHGNIMLRVVTKTNWVQKGFAKIYVFRCLLWTWWQWQSCNICFARDLYPYVRKEQTLMMFKNKPTTDIPKTSIIFPPSLECTSHIIVWLMRINYMLWVYKGRNLRDSFLHWKLFGQRFFYSTSCVYERSRMAWM